MTVVIRDEQPWGPRRWGKDGARLGRFEHRCRAWRGTTQGSVGAGRGLAPPSAPAGRGQMLLTSRQAAVRRGGKRQWRDRDIRRGADSEISPAAIAAGPGHFPDGPLQQAEEREKGSGSTAGHRRPPRDSVSYFISPSLPRRPSPGPGAPRRAVLTAGPSAVV